MKIRHLDLFSGIEGFAYAVDQVFPGSEHIFCDNDKFCQQVIHKHWPNSKIYGDIKEIKSITDSDWNGLQKPGTKEQTSGDRQLPKITADTASTGQLRQEQSKDSGQGAGGRSQNEFGQKDTRVDLLTGGFPCQPFSQAGKRKGTEDERYLWPEMLRVIQLAKPKWVIAENVRGILTIKGGLVFEQVCADLEREDYSVQAFIIPACAVNAPHRRDRVWIIAHTKGCDDRGELRNISSESEKKQRPQNIYKEKSSEFANADSNVAYTKGERNGGCSGKECGVQERKLEPEKQGRSEVRSENKRCFGNAPDSESGQSGEQTKSKRRQDFSRRDWEANWLEVATELCGVDDGISARLDGFEYTKSQHRVQRLKALGNAIVPAVAIEIMRAIKTTNNNLTPLLK